MGRLKHNAMDNESIVAGFLHRFKSSTINDHVELVAILDATVERGRLLVEWEADEPTQPGGEKLIEALASLKKE